MSNDKLRGEDIQRLARCLYDLQIDNQRAQAIAGELGYLKATLKGEVGQLRTRKFLLKSLLKHRWQLFSTGIQQSMLFYRLMPNKRLPMLV